MASTLQLIPTKGMTLPFISYGGSSVLAMALWVGMMLALTREPPACGRRCDGRAASRVVLAAGGTGGHVFPAEALAGELEARGVPFALVTDSRGRQWQGALAAPADPLHPFGEPQPVRWAVALQGDAARSAAACSTRWWALGRIGPSAVVGFGGYASVPTMIAAAPAPACRPCCTSRTRCWAGPIVCAGRRGAGRDLVRPHPPPRRGRPPGASRRQSRARAGARRCAASPIARPARAGSSIS